MIFLVQIMIETLSQLGLKKDIFPHVVAPLGHERSTYNLYSAKQKTIRPGTLPARPSKKHHTAESSLVK